MTTRALRRHPRAPLQLKWSRLLFGVWLACAFAQRGIGAPTQLYPLTVLSDNPNAYWRLDETSGFVAHDRVVGHDCSLTNVQLNAVGYSAADADTAAMFGLLASTNSYAGELDLSSNGIPNIDFAQPAGNSVESWVKGNPQVNNAGIITKGHGNGGEQFSLDTGSDTVANHGFRFVIQMPAR